MGMPHAYCGWSPDGPAIHRLLLERHKGLLLKARLYGKRIRFTDAEQNSPVRSCNAALCSAIAWTFAAAARSASM